MHKEAAFEWAASLRANAEKKGRGALASSDLSHFCCLGWLCKMHGYQFKGGRLLTPAGGDVVFTDLVQSKVPFDLAQKLGSKNLSDGGLWRGVKVIINDTTFDNLADVNDIQPSIDWHQIADWIEANYKQI